MFEDVQTKLSPESVDFMENGGIQTIQEANILDLGESLVTPAQNILDSVSKNAKESLGEDVLFDEGLNADELRLCAAKAKGNIMRRMSVMSTYANTTASTPIDVSSAIPINVDTVYTINNFAAGKQLLVKVETAGIAKLSSAIRFTAPTTVGTVIFTVDGNSVPTIVADSVNVIEDFDILSCLPQGGGSYYVLYTVYNGGGNVALTLQTSTTYSVNEPNDSPSQAVLRHEEVYVHDTYDNLLDTDYVRVQITKPETMVLSMAFVNKHLTGTIVDFGIYHKSDENGNPVNRWIKNLRFSLPLFGYLWENTDAKGEFYIYTQYLSGDNLNQPYVLCLTPASKLPCPTYIRTGRKGITGLQSGYVEGYHWVMGAFTVIADFRDGLSKNVDGLYPCFITQIKLVGKDENRLYDFKTNSSVSGPVITTPDGIATISSLLPQSYGRDKAFSGTKFIHSYDVNKVYFFFLTYNPDATKPEDKLVLQVNPSTFCEFEEFLNLKD